MLMFGKYICTTQRYLQNDVWLIYYRFFFLQIKKKPTFACFILNHETSSTCLLKFSDRNSQRKKGTSRQSGSRARLGSNPYFFIVIIITFHAISGYFYSSWRYFNGSGHLGSGLDLTRCLWVFLYWNLIRNMKRVFVKMLFFVGRCKKKYLADRLEILIRYS